MTSQSKRSSVFSLNDSISSLCLWSTSFVWQAGAAEPAKYVSDAVETDIDDAFEQLITDLDMKTPQATPMRALAIDKKRYLVEQHLAFQRQPSTAQALLSSASAEVLRVGQGVYDAVLRTAVEKAHLSSRVSSIAAQARKLTDTSPARFATRNNAPLQRILQRALRYARWTILNGR